MTLPFAAYGVHNNARHVPQIVGLKLAMLALGPFLYIDGHGKKACYCKGNIHETCGRGVTIALHETQI